MSNFTALGVDAWLTKQCQYMALDTPTPIQQQCIPAILASKHVVGGAATGSGKTAAFALPLLQILAKEMYGVFALVFTPSRELAYQIADQFIAFGAPLHIRTMLAIGGTPCEDQVDALKGRPHVVIATPGRLRHLLTIFPQETLKAFAYLRFMVLDEADRLTEGDIQEDMKVLLSLLPPRPGRQVLLFSATLSSRLTRLSTVAVDGETSETPWLQLLGITDSASFEVKMVQGAISEPSAAPTEETTVNSPATRAASSPFVLPSTLQQCYIFIPNMVKLPHLVAALRAEGKDQSTMVFVNSCLRAELVRLTLQLLGFPVCSLNALLTQQHRLDCVASFKLGIARILVCTDIAARGLDIPAVGAVIHYDVPKDAATYVHRVGRTARAGRSGVSLAFVTEYDVALVQRIEKRLGAKMQRWKSPAGKESHVLPILDEVSAAKVQAKLQVTEQFGNRANTRKMQAAEKKEQRAEALAAQRAAKLQRSAAATVATGSSEAQMSSSSPASVATRVPSGASRLKRGRSGTRGDGVVAMNASVSNPTKKSRCEAGESGVTNEKSERTTKKAIKGKPSPSKKITSKRPVDST